MSCSIATPATATPVTNATPVTADAYAPFTHQFFYEQLVLNVTLTRMVYEMKRNKVLRPYIQHAREIAAKQVRDALYGFKWDEDEDEEMDFSVPLSFDSDMDTSD